MRKNTYRLCTQYYNHQATIRRRYSTRFNQIPKLLSGEGLGEKVDKDYCFVETEDQFQDYKDQFDDAEKIVVDIETTSVSPHTGSILGIAMSTRPHQGIYVSVDIVNKHKQWFHVVFRKNLYLP